jgi:t-SNARE complex subunit (syntaxin)
MFLQIAALISLQGEIIDNIAENISTAKQDVLKAEEDVIKSKKNMQSARKKKCFIIIFTVICLIVIVFPILGVKIWSA